jgi:hypothetical protein
MKDAAKKMRIAGIHPAKIQDFLQHYASKKPEHQDELRNIMSDIGRQEVHRTKITPKGGMSAALLSGDVVRVARRNPASGRWEYKSFHKDNSDAIDLQHWLGKDTGKVWKKWKDIQEKTSNRMVEPEAGKPLNVGRGITNLFGLLGPTE